MTELTHLSLFSGIGGLDLAAEWAGFQTIGQCEFAEFQTKVLEKHWANVPRWKDAREFTGKSFYERTGAEEVTVISGGFPCQPHSLAGKRMASADERDLWPEYRRIIGEVRPKWVVAENVRGLLSSEDGRFFRGILRDLSELGYDAGWCTYPACWVGAVHRRERVFTVAHANSGGRRGRGISENLSSERALDEASEKQYNLWAKATLRLMQFISNPVSAPEDIRANYGIPDWMDRIKSIGNSVCPYQAFPIFKYIAEIEIAASGGKGKNS